MSATNEPVLSADFAERVLARADVTIARRRVARRVMFGFVAFSLVSAGVISWAAMSGSRQLIVPQPAAQAVASLDATTEAQTDEPDALSALFPDAAPVARFAVEYSDATYGSDTSLLAEQDPTS
jgi:hypothetical protein